MSEAAATENSSPKKSSLKSIIMIVVMLLGEAGLIVGAMMVVGKPASVSGDVEKPPAELESEKIVEVLVLDDRLPNNRSGITYLYPTEIYIQVRRKHEPLVQDQLKQFQNEIRAEISAIWKTAEPRHFQEPMLENLTRKVQALMDGRFGNDQDTGEPVVSKCVIVSGTGFRVDG